MPSVEPLGPLDATQIAASLEALRVAHNDLLASIEPLSRDDNALADNAVRKRCLHAEVLSLLIGKAASNVIACVTAQGPYTLTDGDCYLRVDASAGPFDITLPMAGAIGSGKTMAYYVKRVDQTANAVHLLRNPASLDTIDGGVSFDLFAGQAFWLMGDGTSKWDIN